MRKGGVVWALGGAPRGQGRKCRCRVARHDASENGGLGALADSAYQDLAHSWARALDRPPRAIDGGGACRGTQGRRFSFAAFPATLRKPLSPRAERGDESLALARCDQILRFPLPPAAGDQLWRILTNGRGLRGPSAPGTRSTVSDGRVNRDAGAPGVGAGTSAVDGAAGGLAGTGADEPTVTCDIPALPRPLASRSPRGARHAAADTTAAHAQRDVDRVGPRRGVWRRRRRLPGARSPRRSAARPASARYSRR